MKQNYEELFAMLYKKSDLPSEDLSVFWHQVASPKLKKFQSNDKTGKWCIFLDANEVDAAWDKIKKHILKTKNVEELFLAKVSTKLGSQNQDKHVICVYTHDWSDQENLIQTRQTLTSLGFTSPLKYKRDQETIEHKYGTEDEFYLTL